jgi:hypothetical protein
MTAASLKRIVEEALAEVGANANFLLVPKGKARSTTWLGIEHGFGIRHYPSGRNVYIVQTRMAGRLRTVTIGPASVLTRHQAQMVARRVIAYAQVGRDPATDRKRIRSAPRFDDFLKEYWTRWSPQWKPSTLATHDGYRRLYLDNAFKGVFIDELNEADVAKWFSDLNNRAGPGAANRTLEISRTCSTKRKHGDTGWRTPIPAGRSGQTSAGSANASCLLMTWPASVMYLRSYASTTIQRFARAARPSRFSC